MVEVLVYLCKLTGKKLFDNYTLTLTQVFPLSLGEKQIAVSLVPRPSSLGPLPRGRLGNEARLQWPCKESGLATSCSSAIVCL